MIQTCCGSLDHQSRSFNERNIPSPHHPYGISDVSIVEHEEKPYTAALMFPSDSKGIIRIVDLKEASE